MKLLKKIFLAFMLPVAISAVAVPAQGDNSDKEESKGTPAISFAEKQYNFGYIAEDGGPVSHFFEFVNTGDAPLVIISATASCGCTRPTFPTEPIAPGKTGKIKVTYLPQGRPGEFDKVVKVRTNVKENKKISLKIMGSVKPAEK